MGVAFQFDTALGIKDLDPSAVFVVGIFKHPVAALRVPVGTSWL